MQRRTNICIKANNRLSIAYYTHSYHVYIALRGKNKSVTNSITEQTLSSLQCERRKKSSFYLRLLSRFSQENDIEIRCRSVEP